ncbi:malectin domain-containing carbohydrate-binding protein [Pontibacter populi]|uniref:Malectin domain-containing carbohydrate-binding protein n=1 Tax=Pontibacter populi TaxID=890055 RepID=A0ABV1RX60_9BACT
MNISFTSGPFLKIVLVILYAVLQLCSTQDSMAQDKGKKKKNKLPPENLQGAYLANAQYNFNTSGLKLASINNPTSLQFGPDGRLYVSQQDGVLKALTIKRNGSNDYTVTSTETIGIINQIPNHNDDGSLASNVTKRQVTGILVTGTAAQPILYVSSSDSRIGGGSSDGDKNLDTNSGIISRLTKVSGGWLKIDLVRGLPRSEENHSVNGMQLNEQTNTLYIAVGGLTNAGAPSNNFAFICEYALSAAILSIDLNFIDALPTIGLGATAYKYDLPTLDDPTRPNNADGTDLNDPFGGNDGLNQAKIVIGGPVQIYSPGYRNSYDLVITKTPGKAGRMYTIDNGANQGWGGHPANEGSDGTVTNNYVSGEPGSTGPGPNDPVINNLDNLHYIGDINSYIAGSHYAGHPTPTRANPAGAGLYTHDGVTGVWRTSKTGSNPLPADWPPVPQTLANPREGDYQNPGVNDLALLTFSNSTNGITEYTASNFNNVLKGTLLAADFGGYIHKITLTEDGSNVTNPRSSTNKLNQDLPFASGFGSQPLDIIAQGDNDVFPGSVWAATYGSDVITIFEPADFVICSGTYSIDIDDDGDGYSNADEIDNGTNPCSASSMPTDFDVDFISDLNDNDDDNDGLGDNIDSFALDSQNGSSTNLPLEYELFNNHPGTGLFGLGFTGLMSNRQPDNDYNNLYDESNLIAGGAVGAFSVVAVSAGDALGTINNQENAFQFGINVSSATGPFTVHTAMLGPFFDNKNAQNYQSQGFYIGTGDQDNYFKIAINANGGQGGIEVIYENAGLPTVQQFPLNSGFPASSLELFLTVDPGAGTIQAKYTQDGGNKIALGSPVSVSGGLLNAIQSSSAVAVGIIATSRNASPFTATWDYIRAYKEPVNTDWTFIEPSKISKWVGYSVMYNNKMYVFSGFDESTAVTSPKVEIYNPSNNTWSLGADMPFPVTHAGITIDGSKVYVAGGFLGGWPSDPLADQLQIYNIETNTWSTGPKLPAKSGGNALVRVGRKLYCFGGLLEDRQTGTQAHFVLDLDNMSAGWISAAPMPDPRCHIATGHVGGKIYALGGQVGHDGSYTDVNVAHVYDPFTDSWTKLKDLPYSRSHSESGTYVIDGKITLVGGRTGTNKVIPNVTIYDPKTDSWTEDTPLPVGLFGPAAEAIETELIVSNGGEASMTNAVNTARKRNIVRTPDYKSGFAPSQLTLNASNGTTVSKDVILWVNSGEPAFTINVSGLPSWLTLSTSSGTIDQLGGTEITITANAANLEPGDYSASITAKSSGYPDAVLSISLKVASGNKVLYVYGSIPPAIHDMKLSDTGNLGMSQFKSALEEVGFVLEESLDASIVLDATKLNNYKVLILGSNNRRFSATEKTAVDAWVKAGGGIIAWSDAAFGFEDGGINSTVGATSDNDLMQQFGMQFLRDNGEGAFALNQWNVNHYINKFNKNAGVTIEAEGASPVRTSSPATILAYMPADKAKLNSLDGPLTPADAAMAVANIGSGRVVGFFDRNAFWNSGDGTYLSKVDNKVFAQRMLLWVSGLEEAAPAEPTVTSPLADITVQKNSSPTQLDLANVFSDDGGISNLTFTIVNNTKPELVATTIEASNLKLTYTANISGTSEITVRATDADGQYIEDVFNVLVMDQSSYKVNAGGGSITSTIGTFTADQFFSPSPGRVYSNKSAIANTTDDALYQTERTSVDNKGTFSYAFPVGNGLYKVVLHFAEIYWTSATKRLFDVNVENVKVLDNYDIFAKAGSLAATTETFIVNVQDGTLNINFSALSSDGGMDRPKVSAIEIIEQSVTNEEKLVANPGSLHFFSQQAGTTSAAQTVSLKNSGTETIEITSVNISGTNSSQFAHNFTDKIVLAPEATASLNITFTPASLGTKVASLNITHSGTNSPLVVGLTGEGHDNVQALRVNSGGNEVSTSLGTFTADQYSSGGGTYTNKNVKEIAGTADDAIYKSERFGAFSYNINVSSGTYLVRLHFAEIYYGAPYGGEGTTGKRIFNVTGEGKPLLTNFDIFAEAGSMTALVKEFTIDVTDGILNLDFSKIVEQPKVSAIEIITTTASSNNPPVVSAPIPNQSATTGVAYSYSFPSNTFMDPNGDALTYTAGLAGGGALPSWLNFNSTSRTFSGTPSATEVGTITVQVTASDGKGGSASDAFDIVVNGSTSDNKVPVANAGPDKSIILPTSSVLLNGSGTDSDGTIASYTWAQESGPNVASFDSKAVATPTVSGLVAGSYIFVLTVTDDKGSTSIPDKVTVTVNTGTQQLEVLGFTLINSDADSEIQELTNGAVLNIATLPSRNINIRANTSSASTGSVEFKLWGSASRSRIDNIAPYALFWEVNGDYSAWNAAVGNYSVRATPYSGADKTGTAGKALTISFSIVDQPTGNQAPTANAGQDKTVALPTSEVTLNGSGTDGDGTVSFYAWTQQAGPNTATLSGVASATLTASNLLEGTYTFRLTVTDNTGATAFDEATVTVLEGGTAGTAYQINSGGGEVVTSLGTFSADNFFSPTPGYKYSKVTEISGTTNDALYQTERSSTTENGTFAYTFPVTNGQYTVVLHFAELYWSSIGQRVFDVAIEGIKVLDNYDIIQKAGASATAIKETFTVNVTDATLGINFSALKSDGGVNRPKISAIEIIPSSAATDPTSSIQTIARVKMHEPVSVIVYPNPFKDVINLLLTSDTSAEFEVKVFDIMGKLIHSSVVDPKSKGDKMYEGLSSITIANNRASSNAIYFLVVENQKLKFRKTIKIVKRE